MKTWVPEENPDWRTLRVEEEGRACSQPRCSRPAVSVFRRFAFYYPKMAYHSRRWFCCDLPDHQYGRMTRYGIVWRRRNFT